MERVALSVLSHKTLTQLTSCLQGHGYSTILGGGDSSAFYADLTDRVSYAVNGALGYETRRGAENTKGLEDRFPRKEKGGLMLGII